MADPATRPEPWLAGLLGSGAVEPSTLMLPASRSAGWRADLRRAAGRERRRRAAVGAGTRAQRLPAGRLRPGPRDAARSWLLGGLLVQRSAEGAMEDLLRAAGADAPPTALALGSDGALRAAVSVRGAAALLRAGPVGSPLDPRHAFAGLGRAQYAGAAAPRPLSSGAVGELAWSLETLAPGRRPWRLSRALAADLAAWCTRLPRSRQPAPIAPYLPSAVERMAGGPVGRLAELVAEGLRDTPTVLTHGDLWLGNVLVLRRGLSAVVDWDAWQPCGVAGTDLLHLLTTQWRIRRRESLGAAWLRRPEASPAYARLTRSYWAELAVTPTPQRLHAVAVCCWTTQVANDVRRRPELADDDRWVEVNVRRVLAELLRQPPLARAAR